MMKNESGRSMVEMLGVLAIIGVLSVGGIAGYTMAMRKYKANEIAAAAAQCAMLARSYNMGNGIDGPQDCTSVLGVANPDSTNVTNFKATLDKNTGKVTVTTGVSDTNLKAAIQGISGKDDGSFDFS